MVHSFTVTDNKNGNITVAFLNDNKQRQIIFVKGTEAYHSFNQLSWKLTDQFAERNTNPSKSIRQSTIERGRNITSQQVIMAMKSAFLFKANVNNKSIFRPIHKSLILNS